MFKIDGYILDYYVWLQTFILQCRGLGFYRTAAVFFNSLVYWRLLKMDTVPDRLGSTLGPSWVIFSSLLRVCTRSMLTNLDIWYSFCISV